MSNNVLPQIKLGIDIGGTFTDLVLVNENSQEIFVGKELTTHDDPSRAVITGLEKLLERYTIPLDALDQVVHATTLITNSIIERKGARTGLVTTEGFGDVLELAREVKYELYDIFLPIPSPLIPRSVRMEIPERITADGEVLIPLDKKELKKAVDFLVSKQVESVAVCFLHSYQNAEHEEEAAKFIHENYPDMYVSISSKISPEIREFERTNTTAANAYVQPLTERYLESLTAKLKERSFSGNFYIMHSSGGLTGVKDAISSPIRLLESGPAAGSLVASFYAQLGEKDHVLAFDMGGTTAKMCLVDEGKPEITYTFEAARERRFKKGSGLPIRVPSVELIEIGAGGGSLARIDELGLLKVGPESAGSSPGPACYGIGGMEPTVTDANLVLGYYNPDFFLGGEMTLDLEASRNAVARVANELGVSIEEAAWGIHNIVNEQMASAARIHVAEKGKDHRLYTFLSTGGAGPCHAWGVSEKLQINEVICPPAAGVASAFGLLVAPTRVDLVKSMPMNLTELNIDILTSLYNELEDQARHLLEEVGVPAEQIQYKRVADMRYIGQGFEIQVPVPNGSLRKVELQQQLENNFARTYMDLFARHIEGAPVEALTWRLEALGPSPSMDFVSAHQQRHQHLQSNASRGKRLVYFPQWQEYREVPVFDRYALGTGVEGEGPAILEERESTAVVPPGGSWRIDQLGALIITLGG